MPSEWHTMSLGNTHKVKQIFSVTDYPKVVVLDVSL